MVVLLRQDKDAVAIAAMNMRQRPLIELTDVCRLYNRDERTIPVLTNVSLCAFRGEAIAIVGKSGSGKSTLMNILGLLDRPSTGRYVFNGTDTGAASPAHLADIRNLEIGFVFQAFNLLPRLTSLDNVALPLFYRGLRRAERRMRAFEQLRRVGLQEHAEHHPSEMSGGQRQRVAIARALVSEPSLILADEPTGSLDPESSADIMELLFEMNNQLKVTVVVITHDQATSERFTRRIEVIDGRLRENVRHATDQFARANAEIHPDRTIYGSTTD